MLRSMNDGSLDTTLLSTSAAEGLDSLMASLPPDQQKYFLEDDIFTPLISPAMTPSMSYQPHHQSVHAHHHPHQQYQHHQQQHQQQDVDFSPLTSPAIMPQPSGDMTPGQIYEQYEQLERAKMMITRRLSELQRKRPREEAIPQQQQQRQQQLQSHHLQEQQFHHAQQHHHPLSTRPPQPRQPPTSSSAKVPLSPAGSPCIEPVTPSSLMNIKSHPNGQQHEPSMPVQVPPAVSIPQTPAAVPPPLMPVSSAPPTSSSTTSSTRSSPTSGSNKRSRRIAPAQQNQQQEHASSPRALKPLLISPTMRPGPVAVPADAERMLATRSNYQNLMEGKAAALGIAFSSTIKSGLEIRRTAHKAAEQKRRDSLKEWFDRLRREVDEGYVKKNVTPPAPPVDDGESSKGDEESKPLSKVLLLKYAYEYISLLKSNIEQRDQRIYQLEQQLNNNNNGDNNDASS
ncbi:hypothetical protein RO3G_00970 [Lichtheimia corymbifera JMRC:FSU:9682]|uniref:BHLH domain-containing protein n=1 Tax=Lichtheimia corymbifera JMRC:FSU:9682 TaxID=1263082 RepID=A0A068RTX9_9FUNG|nr:hypothetical protein RO3G_00970 [Lichtheimia corymbifera JMRC:FSU:9682]